jgi:hypothetical protein
LEVEIGDGRRLMGWLRYYSDEPQDSNLFLENAAWIVDGDPVPIDGSGILITKRLGINWIGFRNPQKAVSELQIF